MRDYGTATWEGGDPACDHRESQPSRTAASVAASPLAGGKGNVHRSHMFRGSCGCCGAQRIDAQIGAEDTPQEFVAHLVEVFRGVWRVLRDDGTLWLVLGDSYAGGKAGRSDADRGQRHSDGRNPATQNPWKGPPRRDNPVPPGYMAKSLFGIPWRLAFALQDDGWILRSAITWCKDNPMPESVTDRPTSATEMVFLLAKKPAYYYDAVAIAERSVSDHGSGNGYKRDHRLTYDGRGREAQWLPQATRNKRNWWRVNSEPLDAEHYAAFPRALVTPMILAGTSEAGCCPRCAAPWRRLVERTAFDRTADRLYGGTLGHNPSGRVPHSNTRGCPDPAPVTTGWEAGCSCDAGPPIPCTTLDPFLGSGTTALVSKRLGRSCVGIELNPAYAEMARRRIESVPHTLFSAAILADDGAAAR